MIDRGIKAHITFRIVLIVIIILAWTIDAQGSMMIDLQFDVTAHDRPVTIRVYQHMTTWVPDDSNAGCLDDNGEYCYTITWEIEIVEDDTPTITPMPTVNPTITPGPSVTPPASGYVASINGAKFHYPDCSHARRILPHNLITFATRAEAIASGRTPCGTCKP